MTDTLFNFFRRPASETGNETPAGFCPNCWGEQKYGDIIREMYEDKQIDVNNHQAHHAFIQDFVINRIEGIHLRKGDNGWECPTCHKVSPQ